MAFDYPVHALSCILDGLKSCFDEYDGNQLSVKCNFNGCWKLKEITHRCGLNILITNARRDNNCPRTMDGCIETVTPMIIDIVFEIYADSCLDDASDKALSGLALVDYTFCNCAGALPVLDIERSTYKMDLAQDRNEYTRTYRRASQTWQAKTLISACAPGATPIGCEKNHVL